MREYIKIIQESFLMGLEKSSYEIFKYVESMHLKTIDFEEGNLENRIYKFDIYILKKILISDINVEEWYSNDEVVEEYKNRVLSGEEIPPIIWDDVDKSIIDGTHRAKAAKELNHTVIWAYCGFEKNINDNWEEYQEDFYD